METEIQFCAHEMTYDGKTWHCIMTGPHQGHYLTRVPDDIGSDMSIILEPENRLLNVGQVIIVWLCILAIVFTGAFLFIEWFMS